MVESLFSSFLHESLHRLIYVLLGAVQYLIHIDSFRYYLPNHASTYNDVYFSAAKKFKTNVNFVVESFDRSNNMLFVDTFRCSYTNEFGNRCMSFVVVVFLRVPFKFRHSIGNEQQGYSALQHAPLFL